MNTKLLTTLSAIALSGMIASANAANFSYNYIEGAYEDIDADGPDGDAFRISGSYDVAPNVNVLAEYADGEIDNPLGGDVDFDETALGVGFHTEIAPTTDFTANAKMVIKDADVIGDDTGYGVGVGLRHKFTHQLEGNANIDFVDVHDDSETSYRVGGRFYLSPALSAGLAYSTSSDDTDIVSGNIRWNF